MGKEQSSDFGGPFAGLEKHHVNSLDKANSVSEVEPQPEVLASVTRKVELLSELYGLKPSAVVDKWIQMGGDLDQLKLDLASNYRLTFAH